ncbi:MAG: YbaB/EbfC family nucleoid-associated protein [Bacteroidetes bacterium]|nr:MAG: YbaB/EbfC family nucleoid-associated protein [Bacteroidota bacterium]
MFGLNNQELLKQMQESVELSKQKMEETRVSGEAAGGLVRIELNGNRRLTNLEVNAPLGDISKEDLEDFISVALNQALEKANELNEQEMAESARQFMPGF